jgi:hypothetical protein
VFETCKQQTGFVSFVKIAVNFKLFDQIKDENRLKTFISRFIYFNIMELLDFPEEILLEILSKLDQETVHLTAVFVCKRFLQLTRSPQLLKCIKYMGVQGYYEGYQSLIEFKVSWLCSATTNT